jgi:hypothetical protein
MKTLGVWQSSQQFPKGRWGELVALGLIAVSAIGFWWPAQAGDASSGAPRLVVDRTEIDLGDLPFDQLATAVFTLTNAGDGVLNILEGPPVEVVKGCCPPRVVVGQRTIEPGKSTSLTLTFSMSADMGGVYELLVRLRTNDPSAPERPLFVRSFWGPR